MLDNKKSLFQKTLLFFSFFLISLLCKSFLSSLVCYVQAREIDGSDNNSNSIQPYQREFSSKSFYGPDGNHSMIKCPSDVVFTNPTLPVPKCTDPLPPDNFPMPRCVSNIITNYHSENFNVEQQLRYRSKRHTSHTASFLAGFILKDIIQSKTDTPSIPIYIPTDDSIYNPPTSQKFQEFNRTSDEMNHVTPFLDLNQLYGLNTEESRKLRDIGNRGKLKMDEKNYPMNYPTSDMIGGFLNRANNIFTLAIQIIWMREHNRLCNQFYDDHGDSWTDDQYFEEARKWNIAFYQKVVTEEYLGIILGKPLPPYQQYNENLVPGVDLFFATITFKYVHSELGNNYHIQDEFGELLADLTLDNILQIQLLEKFGMERVLRSMSLQHQEELDIYYSDAMRNATTIEPRIYDIAAFDVLRARDRGIALYNDARQAYGLTTKKTWQGITSVKILQDYLQQLYPNGPNQLETFVGAIVEDHLDGSNFGELMSISMFTQFTKIRDSDKFWWENGNMFTDVERVTLKSTTFKDIILRNLPENNKPIMPQNIWTVQPQSKTTNSSSAVDVNYPNNIPAWSPYVIKYRIDDSFIHFKITLQTDDGEGWFGMGFEPDDIGMKGADFVIGFVRENKIDIFNYRSSSADHYPPNRDDNSDLTNINSNVSDSLATIEFSRPLLPDGRRGIKDGHVKCKKKYPFSSSFTYHGNNRILIMIDFYNNKIEAVKIKASQQTTKYIHGIGMSFTWSVLFPISIFIVRFFKHTNNYLKIHRTIQLLGGISIGSFGAAALAVAGLALYCLVFIQLAIGLISIWSQASLVSTFTGDLSKNPLDNYNNDSSFGLQSSSSSLSISSIPSLSSPSLAAAVEASTTFKDIILRNLPENNKPIMPQNIWTVQPQSKTTNSSSAVDVNYPNDIPAWSPYVIKYRIDDSFIHFKITLQTDDGEGWFGMGFEPDDIGMKGADFVIGFVRENKIDIFNYRSSSADHYPPNRDDNSDLTNINSNVSDSLATIEFSRPLLPDGRRGIKDGLVKCKKKYPFSSSFTYHGNNRILIMIDFYNNKIEAVKIKASQQTTKYIHGIGMSFTWSVLFPISIFIVRFFKHTNNYLKIHRTIQLLGGISIGSFGASVLAMSNSRTPHSFLGLTLYCIVFIQLAIGLISIWTLYCLVFIQLAIGLISIWSQASLVSVNLGYPRFFKRTHKFLGISLLIVSWINIYLGMVTYSLSYGK
ncbi:17875_t:CDS:10 [Entrophospora sp. SA101]|nr:17875_t:CDS:10 [Entrophospora sp. SA101]